jgi:hypothetical protein
LLCRRTTGAIVFSEAWPVNNAQTLQVLCGRRPLPTLHFLDDPSAAKSVASVSGLVLHASVDFLRLKDLLTVGNSDMHALVDRVWVLTLKSENVGQKRLDERPSRASPIAQSRIYPSLGAVQRSPLTGGAWTREVFAATVKHGPRSGGQSGGRRPGAVAANQSDTKDSCLGGFR